MIYINIYISLCLQNLTKISNMKNIDNNYELIK